MQKTSRTGQEIVRGSPFWVPGSCSGSWFDWAPDPARSGEMNRVALPMSSAGQTVARGHDAPVHSDAAATLKQDRIVRMGVWVV